MVVFIIFVVLMLLFYLWSRNGAKDMLEKNLQDEGFNYTYRCDHPRSLFRIGIDQPGRKVLIAGILTKQIILDFEELRSVEFRVNGHTELSRSFGDVAAGVMMGGVLGAAMAKQTANQKIDSMKLIIGTRNYSYPQIELDCGAHETYIDEWRRASEQAASMLTNVIDQVEREQRASAQQQPVTGSADTAPAAATYSVADEIRKFKQLMDEGIITEQEFQGRKRELIGR